MFRRCAALLATVLTAGACLALPASAGADVPTCTTTWTGAVSGSFTDAGNWTNGTPGAQDVACIDLDGTSTITVDGPVTVDALVIDNGSGTQTLQVLPGGMLTLAGPDQSLIGTNAAVQVGDATDGGGQTAVLVDEGPLTDQNTITVTADGNWTQGDGAISVNAVYDIGQLDFTGSGAGRFYVGGNATLTGSTVSGQNVTVQPSVDWNLGGGTDTAEVTWTTPATIGGTLTLQGGLTLSSPSNSALTIAPGGQLVSTDTGNTVDGSIVNDGVFHLAGVSSLSYDSGKLTNNATLTADAGGRLIGRGSSVFDNATGGTVTVDGALTAANWHQDGGTVTEGSDIGIDDGGSLDLTGDGGGAYDVFGNVTVDGNIAADQTVTALAASVTPGTVTFPGSVTNAGTLILNTANVAEYLAVAGSLTNTGTIKFSVNSAENSGLTSGSLVNDGTLDLGVPTLTAGDSYTQNPDGTLVTGVGYTSVDNLTTTGPAQLAGTLEVEHSQGSQPPSGSFPVVTAASVTGTFSPLAFTDPVQPFKVSYAQSAVTVSAATHTAIAVNHPSSLNIGASTTLVATLKSSNFGGTVSGATVAAYATPAGGARRLLGTATTNDAGQVAFPVKPRVNTAYAFSYAGDASHFASTRTCTLPVHPAITMKASAIKLPTRDKETFTGVITPIRKGTTIHLQEIAYDATYRTIKTVTTDRHGRYSITIRAPKGDNTYRTATAATKTNAAGIAKPITIHAR